MSDTSRQTEYELVRKARQGDADALGVLIEQNRARLFALAYAELRHYADAQDAVASALLNICLSIRRLRRPERMYAWMNAIVRNEARRLRRGPDAPLPLEDFSLESLSSDTLQTVLRQTEIAQALQQLSPRQEQAIRMFYFAQRSVREISQCMQASEGTVKSWLYHGRQRLAAAMKEDMMTTSANQAQPADSRSAADLLKMYAQQFDRDPMTADRDLLEQTRLCLKAELQRQPLSAELAHLAVNLHWGWSADPEFLAALLAEYLQQPLAVPEEAWARYEYVNILCVLQRSAEAVNLQRETLAWGRARWEAGQLTSEQLLRLISNSGQAEQWTHLGLTKEWIALFNDLMAILPPNAANRMERFYALRTAGLRVATNGSREEVLALTEWIRALGEEDPQWDKAYEMQVQADIEAMRIYRRENDTAEVLALGAHATGLLEQQRRSAGEMTQEARIRLMIQYDNLACSLYFERLYALSIPLHRAALELGYNQEYAYLWLAASVWAHMGDRAEALELLRQGRARSRSVEAYQEQFAGLLEFQEVKETPDFVAAVTGTER